MMGLDLFEITLRIEDTFEVPFSNEDLTKLVHDRDIMVGDLYDLILTKLHLRDVGRYDLRLNYALWEELRGILHSVTKEPPDRIQLKTPLANLFPQKTRRVSWEELRDACPYRVRKLDYPKAARTVGFSLAAAMVLVEQLQIWRVPGAKWFWPAIGLLGLWMVGETYAKVLWVLSPLRYDFPSGITTVKDLCRLVLATNYEDICGGADMTLDKRSIAVWQQLTGILSDELGVEANAVTFRSRLVQDLGAA